MEWNRSIYKKHAAIGMLTNNTIFRETDNLDNGKSVFL